jgi:hypothetical protein
MGEACSTHREISNINYFYWKIGCRCKLSDLGINGRFILGWSLKKRTEASAEDRDLWLADVNAGMDI